jgi:hypothetical protein
MFTETSSAASIKEVNLMKRNEKTKVFYKDGQIGIPCVHFHYLGADVWIESSKSKDFLRRCFCVFRAERHARIVLRHLREIQQITEDINKSGWAD